MTSIANEAVHFATEVRRALKTAIRERPATVFLVLTFAVSYPLGIVFSGFTSSLVRENPLTSLYLPRLVTVLGPALAACIVTVAGRGPVGVRELMRSCYVPRRYLLAAIAIVTLALLITSLAFVLAGVPVHQATDLVSSGAWMLSAHFIIQCAVIGLGEELGCRGWLLPYLSRRRGFVTGTALTGLAWTAWHGPVFFGTFPVALTFVLLLSSLTVVYAWLWKRSGGSVGLVAIAHGAVNAPFFFFEGALRKVGAESVISRAFLYQALFCACFALCTAADRRTWSPATVASVDTQSASPTAA